MEEEEEEEKEEEDLMSDSIGLGLKFRLLTLDRERRFLLLRFLGLKYVSFLLGLEWVSFLLGWMQRME